MTVAQIEAAQVNKKLVEELEFLLEQAKEGVLVGAAWGLLFADGEAGTGWALDFRANRYTLVGVLDGVKYDVMTTLSLHNGLLASAL